MSHTESSVFNAVTLRLSVLMTVPAGKEVTKEGCKKTTEHDGPMTAEVSGEKTMNHNGEIMS